MNGRILAIETSGTRGSLALGEGAAIVREVLLDEQARTTQTLAPSIRRLLTESGWQPREIDAVAVTVGPGSFTGLRIGVTTAKAFAYAMSAKIIGIDTLEAIAHQVPPALAAARRIHVIIDAFRSEVFTAAFRLDEHGEPRRCGENAVVAVERWLEELSADDDLLTGPGLAKYAAAIPASMARAPAETWQPRAGTVARLAAQRATAGAFDDLFALTPRYHRLAAAEEKRPAKPEA